MRFTAPLTERVSDPLQDRINRNHDERLRQLVAHVEALENRVGLTGGIVMLHQTITGAADHVRIPRSAQVPIVVIELAGAVATLTSLPNIDQGLSDGQILVIRRPASGGTITFQDASVLAGSSLRLEGGANLGMTPRDTVLFVWRAITREWWQAAPRLAA